MCRGFVLNPGSFDVGHVNVYLRPGYAVPGEHKPHISVGCPLVSSSGIVDHALRLNSPGSSQIKLMGAIRHQQVSPCVGRHVSPSTGTCSNPSRHSSPWHAGERHPRQGDYDGGIADVTVFRASGLVHPEAPRTSAWRIVKGVGLRCGRHEVIGR